MNNPITGHGWLGEFVWSTNEKQEFRDHSLQKIADIVARYGGTVTPHEKGPNGPWLDIQVPEENKVECTIEVGEAMRAMGCPV